MKLYYSEDADKFGKEMVEAVCEKLRNDGVSGVYVQQKCSEGDPMVAKFHGRGFYEGWGFKVWEGEEAAEERHGEGVVYG